MSAASVAIRPDFRVRRHATLWLATLVLCLSLQTGVSALSQAAGDFVRVIVQGTTSEQARDAVESVGGKVSRDLWIVDGVSARVPRSSLPALQAIDSVRQVSPNSKVAFNGRFQRTSTQRIPKVVRSDKLWNEGITGAGVAVALLDTGVYAAHPDLQGSNGSRVIACKDLTIESTTEANCQDTFGHGTFMAGLIAGNGASSGGLWKGAAPQANIVSVKAAGFDGSTDVSIILAGVQWIVAHKDDFGIRVMNLSLGTDSSQSYALSPMNYAVERAWQSGIVVNVSAGNSGPDAGTVMKPGDDPYVITVGASSDQGTNTLSDDRVASFSSRGPTRADGLTKPDVVSPGVHTISLQSPGSNIDQNHGDHARVGNGYFKGTGTSMSTATVSGVVAQVLQANPELSPDQVKYRLMATAREIADDDPNAAGQGLIDAKEAAYTLLPGVANVGIPASTGSGLLQLDRGTFGVDVATPLGSFALIGEFKAQTDPDKVSIDNPAGMVPWVGTQWRSEGWDGTQWRDEEWDGTQWRGTQWRATVWDGTQWRGTQWRNEDWEGTQWRNEDWDGTQWRATDWQSHWYAVQWD